MSSPRLKFYCPACGEDIVKVLDNEFSLYPGKLNLICSQCETHFLVKVEFEEIEKEV